MATHPKPSLHTSPNKLLKALDGKPYPPPQSPSPFVSRGKSIINDGTTSVPIKKEIKNEPDDCNGFFLSSGGGIGRTSIPIMKEVKIEPVVFSDNGGASRGCIDGTSIPIKKVVKTEPVDSSGICCLESENGGASGGCIDRTSIPIMKEVKKEPESENSSVSGRCIDRTSIPIMKEVKKEPEPDNSGVSGRCIDRTSVPIMKEAKKEPEPDNSRVSGRCIDRTSVPIMKEAKKEPESDNSRVSGRCTDRTSTPVKKIVKNQPESDNSCGICLWQSDNGRVAKGYIDSCNHSFCFICIREWSKVESKCPLCKRRFSTIRRPPDPPIFTTERIIHVPLRDQNHHYSGNATNVPPEPYEEVKCSVCHGVADEHLLLLCDKCDAASHTYCVGLGSTVPEGDWVCQECTLLKDEHLETDSDSDSDSDTVWGTHKPSTPVTENQTHPNARTLQHCRNLNDRIRILRENWNGFRNGTLQFSSPCGNISCKKSATGKTRRYSVSCLNNQSEVQRSSSDITNDVGSRNIKKAWKMMKKAKSVKWGRRFRTVRQSSESHLRKPNAMESPKHINYRHLSPDSKQIGSKNVVSAGQGSNPNHSLTKDSYKQAYSVCGEQKWKRHITEDVRNCYVDSVTGHSSTCSGLISSTAVPTEKSFKGPACLSSSVMSEPIVLNGDHVKGSSHTSSSHSKVQHSKEKIELEGICVDRLQYNDAKSEIRSLVKLRLQTKKEKLGVDAFKDVARLATHSILAACGLEHEKPGFCSVPGFICSHTNTVGLFQISSSLMPNCCRECFHVFVKEMVNSVMLQKKSY